MNNSIKLKNDITISIATGKSSKDTNWQNEKMLYSSFLNRLSQTQRTKETFAEYKQASKDRQSQIKDCGGFIGGWLNGGRRNSLAVLHRSVVCLDIDNGTLNFWDRFKSIFRSAATIHTTHKHCPEFPRYRLIIPLDREVTPDQYQAIARHIADSVGMQFFDSTTFAPERLMYWPSTSQDGDYMFDYQDMPFLSADDALATYDNWQDRKQWPKCGNEREPDNIAKKLGNPLEKPGNIGAFCRTYSIEEAVETFLSDKYMPTDIEGRYTYINGSTAAGLVLYENLYAYSHHSTDPAGNKGCNAFDLVRIHKFGDYDKGIADKTPINKLPSFKAMIDFAGNDPNVIQTLAQEQQLQIQEEFGDEEADKDQQFDQSDNGWKKMMKKNNNGEPLPILSNVLAILVNDPRLKRSISYNTFAQAIEIVTPFPWMKQVKDRQQFESTDVPHLKYYLEKKYKITAKTETVSDAIKIAMKRNEFNPVKDFLSATEWDGICRLDTLFIAYLGAEDTEYTRTVTRKTFVAAVSRIFEPGCKFDYMLVLFGQQGIGKSKIIRTLAGNWFTDNLSMHTIQKGKEAAEQLQGNWIIEIPELAGMRKAESEGIKAFISRQVDMYRVPYDTQVKQFQRQCIFIGTTNNSSFLHDVTGNRRYWVVSVGNSERRKDIDVDLTPAVVAQIWAEALHYYNEGELLYLPAEIEEEANKVQQYHSEQDERKGIIMDYLEKPLPENWEDMNLQDRISYYSDDTLQRQGTVKRQRVCAAEIFCELFKSSVKDLGNKNTKFIHDIMQAMPGWKKTKSNRGFKIYGMQAAYQRK